MNYYKARQREGGRWDYTCMNDGRIWAVGYCAGKYEDVREAAEPAVAVNYHENGHATPEEARECYKRYLLDTSMVLDARLSQQQRKCEAEDCDEWTQGLARIGPMESIVLCDQHRTREKVEKLFSVGESMSSY